MMHFIRDITEKRLQEILLELSVSTMTANQNLNCIEHEVLVGLQDIGHSLSGVAMEFGLLNKIILCPKSEFQDFGIKRTIGD